MDDQIRDFFSQFSPDVAEIGQKIFDLTMRTMLPEKKMWIDHADKMIVFGTEKTMKGEICYIRPLKDTVNLGFFHGAVLPDPHRLLQGTGKMLRHVKIKKKNLPDTAAIQQLLLDALNEHNNRLKLQ